MKTGVVLISCNVHSPAHCSKLNLNPGDRLGLDYFKGGKSRVMIFLLTFEAICSLNKHRFKYITYGLLAGLVVYFPGRDNICNSL